jgi:hypothetical protein
MYRMLGEEYFQLFGKSSMASKGTAILRRRIWKFEDAEATEKLDSC